MADPAYAAHQMRYYCETLNIGYSQPNRNNIYNGGEADCSSLVLRCCKDAGIPTGNAYSTRDMRREMIKAGWQVYNGVAATKASNLLPGDVLLAEGHHTCMYVGNGLIGEAAIDERGGIMGSAGGGQAGDQTGRETRVTALYSFPWTHVLRWPASASSGGKPTENTKHNDHKEHDMNLIYTKDPHGNTLYAIVSGGVAGARIIDNKYCEVSSYQRMLGDTRYAEYDFFNLLIRQAKERQNDLIKAVADTVVKTIKG